MQRLSYSPKCFAWVECANIGGQVVPLTDYVVRGQIRRATEAVSTAELILRNPGKIWTGGQSGNSRNTFSPMDKITIFLEKIPGKPLQVFTGFLDTAPLYQMYPGVVTLKASCTLKRLLYTYWDPALPFVIEFLTGLGWIADGNGNLTNYTQTAQGADTILSYQSAQAQAVANARINESITVDSDIKAGTTGSVYINYGTSTGYGQTTQPVTFNDWTLVDNISITVNNLKPNTTYHYQVVVNQTVPLLPTPLTANDQTFNTGGVSTPGDGFQLTDSSLSNVLYSVIEQICGWTPDSVFIEALPNGMAEQLLVLYKDLAETESVVLQQLQHFLSQLIGSGSYGDATSNASASNPDGVLPTGAVIDPKKLFKIWKKIGDYYHVPLAFIATVAYLESRWLPNKTNPTGHDGYFQMQLGSPCYRYGPGLTHSATKQVTRDASLSCEWFCAAAHGWITDANNPSWVKEENWSTWAANTQGIVGHLKDNATYYPEPFNKTVAQVKATISHLGINPGGSYNPFGPPTPTTPAPPNTSTKSATKKGGNAKDKTAQSKSGYSHPLAEMPKQFNVTDKSYGGIDQGVILLTGKRNDPVYSITKGKIYFQDGGGPGTSPTGNLYGPHYPVVEVSDGPWKGRTIFYGYVLKENSLSDGDSVHPGEQIGTVAYSAKDQTSGMGMVDIGFYTGDHTSAPYPWSPGLPSTQDAATMLTNMRQMVAGDALYPSSPIPPTGLANTKIQTPDVQSVGVAAAFSTIFSFPTIENTETALMLTGDKSYMNDQSILPFIQQLCKGCLRSFQSMPNGNLFIFFPDYFGALSGRDPYWQIHDIEILDGNIEISDQALATHVFVTGDTLIANAGTVSKFDQIASTGVVTLTNAGISNFLKHGTPINDTKSQTVGIGAGSVLGDDAQLLSTPQDILGFLRRYGVRPLVEDNPVIHSHYYELFIAYQLFRLMWARQYITTFTFTFMPELYPGGRVAFPDHGISMYIDEVMHVFDYEEGGFVTQANLMAPAALPNTNVPFTNGLVVDKSFTRANPGQ